MAIQKVTTQKELLEAIRIGNSVEIRSGTWCVQDATVYAYDHADITALGNSKVFAQGEARICATNNSTVIAWGRTSIDLRQSAAAFLTGCSTLTAAYGNCIVFAEPTVYINQLGIGPNVQIHELQAGQGSRLSNTERQIVEWIVR